MCKVLYLVIITGCIFLGIESNAVADTNQTSIENTQIENTIPSMENMQETQFQKSKDQQSSINLLKLRAGNLNLTPKEYSQYLNYMNNNIDKYEYSKSVNPNIILAIHAKDSASYKKYLENAAKEDYLATARLLKVNQDYTATLKHLHPNEKPIMTPNMRQTQQGLKPGDNVQIYCDISTASCMNLVSTVYSSLKSSTGSQLAIYAVNKTTRNQFISFVEKQGIPSSLVADHTVTLNMDIDALKLLEDKLGKKLPLPFLMVTHDNRVIQVNLGNKV